MSVALLDLPRHVEPRALELQQAMLPRGAFFATAEHVPAFQAIGRVAAETISPYPLGGHQQGPVL
ncbi:hypothetical protein ACF1GY_36810 [Streptomyces sp. NPDC014684]|uniref:hypothetical protein n=1 Tax=Streptomyces sp. NPDC014684 TaxID=3364880 RepID=UPI0036F7CE79